VTEPAETESAEVAADAVPEAAGVQSMTYTEFGSRFIHEAVAPQRISDVIGGIAGEAVKVGPLDAGPGGVATAAAVGHLGEPAIAVIGEEPLTYAVDIPVDLDLDVTVAGTKHHYDIDATVRIVITVVLAPPLSICIVPDSPTYKDVTVDVHPRGLQAKVIGRVGDIERELRKHIARYLRERINTEVSDFSTVDLLPLMTRVADQMTSSKRREG
jgi:hypothetical protein